MRPATSTANSSRREHRGRFGPARPASAMSRRSARSCNRTIAGLYRLARGILRNDGEAEDVVQETYVRAFTHLHDFRGDSSLATWLGRIAINEALGRLRRQRSNVEWTSLPPGTLEAQIIQFPLSAASEDPERSMAQREIQHVVEHAIDDLPEAFRIVFITARDRGDERRGDCGNARTETGDRENPTAPRPAPCCATMSKRKSALWSWRRFRLPASAASA